MAALSTALRTAVIERAAGRCEYCQTQAAIVVEMEVDHIVPESAGGPTAADNLCLACIGCNGFKLAFQNGVDPETGTDVALFHPRNERWDDHFRWSADGTRVIGMTATGRATVNRLRINRPRMVEARMLWVAAGWHPPVR